MNLDNKITLLKNINYFNFDGPYQENTSYNSNIVVTKIITSFIRKYSNEIKQHYTFIIKYDNDIYSYLAFRLIRAAGIAIQAELDIRMLGTIKLPEEKEFFKGLKTIGYRKAKKMKKAILITSYHPICNVENLDNLSKVFIEIHNPLNILTPENLNLIQDFYVKEDSFLYKKDLGNHTLIESYWYSFFQFPIGKTEMNTSNNTKKDYFFYPVNLSGTVDDFGLFDKIRELDKDDSSIIIYNISILDEEKIKFIKCNLNPYLSFKNQLNDFNSFSDLEIKSLIVTEGYDGFEMNYQNYQNYIEKEDKITNEDSNS